MKEYLIFINNPFYKNIALTLTFIIVGLVLRSFLLRGLKKNSVLDEEEKAFTRKKIKSYLNLITMFLIVLVWFSHVQGILISMMAVAAAIVIALKEIIMCITGGILISINKLYRRGDFLDVEKVRGIVLDKNIFVTRLLELGTERNSQQLTGRIVALPNSIMLSKLIINESYFDGFSIKSFTFTPYEGVSLEQNENFLLNLATEISSPYLKLAEASILASCRKEGIKAPSLGPRIKVILRPDNKVDLMLKMPVENESISNIEQQLIRSYILWGEENKLVRPEVALEQKQDEE